MGPLVAILLAGAPTGLTATMERVDLVRSGKGEVEVSVDPLGRTIVVRNARPAAKARSLTCPATRVRGAVTTLACTTRQLWARLERDRRGPYLDVRTLRGMPLEAELQIPVRPYPVRAMGVPDDCPGKQDVTRAECALAAGDEDEAERIFAGAANGPDSSFARLRLGDLAIRDGRFEDAIDRYRSVISQGQAGRMARAKLCDLVGTCLEATASALMGDTAGLASEIKAELDLITWRREIVMGREERVMEALADGLWREPTICAGAEALCQRMLIAGLLSDAVVSREEALRGYLAPMRLVGPHDSELARAAAEAAEHLGAPAFAASVLASVSSRVPPAELGPHLLRIYGLFARASDPVRAQVILDYARARLPRGATGSTAWAEAARPLKPAPPPPMRPPGMPVDDLERDVELARDLARAATLVSQSRGGP